MSAPKPKLRVLCFPHPPKVDSRILARMEQVAEREGKELVLIPYENTMAAEVFPQGYWMILDEVNDISEEQWANFYSWRKK